MQRRALLIGANGLALLAHLGSAIALSVLLATRLSGVTTDVVVRGIHVDDTATPPLVTEAVGTIGAWHLGWLLVTTDSVTVLFHAARVLLLLANPVPYEALLDFGFNPTVWAEFAVTAALPWLFLTLFSGSGDLLSALVSALIFSCVNLGGLCIEWRLYRKRRRALGRFDCVDYAADVWAPFGVLSALALLPALAEISRFIFSVASSGGVPVFVWFTVVGTLLQYATFYGGLFALQRLSEMKGWEWPRRYHFFAVAYAGASLVTKVTIAWSFAGGLSSRV